jgi:pyruvate/2-oxoglutarate dehydrogenase complex dihydrolipoamide dehydrogenase (E3) component
VIATGAVPAVPPIKGLKDYYWADYLLDENLPQNEKIVIIGGGLIGIEMASKLVDRENEVIVVEMLSEIARGMEMIEKKMTLAKLKAKNTQILLNYKVIEIDGDKVILSGAEDKVLEGVDKIIVTAGMKSLNELEEKLKDEVELYVIGDAHQVGKAQEAIRDGYETALRI